MKIACLKNSYILKHDGGTICHVFHKFNMIIRCNACPHAVQYLILGWAK